MTRIIVYVEGESDKLGLEALLRDLKRQLGQQGVSLRFIPAGSKSDLVQRQPRRAARILAEDPDAIVVLVPDLYPADQGGQHRTPEALSQLTEGFLQRAVREIGASEQSCRHRFKTFCFKHDFESLLLAAQEQLAGRLRCALNRTWSARVEDQDFDHPPKSIVDELFLRHLGRHYTATADAPLILASADYRALAAACPQCFAPFVAFLESFL